MMHFASSDCDQEEAVVKDPSLNAHADLKCHCFDEMPSANGNGFFLLCDTPSVWLTPSTASLQHCNHVTEPSFPEHTSTHETGTYISFEKLKISCFEHKSCWSKSPRTRVHPVEEAYPFCSFYSFSTAPLVILHHLLRRNIGLHPCVPLIHTIASATGFTIDSDLLYLDRL
jgi:hypothetical protein